MKSALNRSRWLTANAMLLVPCAGLHANGDPADPLRGTLAVDVVELLQGKETPGFEALSETHGGYRYLFATPENKAAFLADPAKHEIQFGGSCGRMGPLSGLGRTELFGVHDGKVYIFASTPCRDTFLKNPAALLETDDTPPTGTEDQAAKGRDLVQKAVAWLGGAERVAALKTMERSRVYTTKAGDKEYRVVQSSTWAYPSSFREFESWNDSWFANVLSDEHAFFDAADGPRPMVETQRRALERVRLHDPIAMLKHHREPGFLAFDKDFGTVRGPGEGQSAAVHWLDCHIQGVTCRLGVDPKTGAIHSIEHKGRGPRSTIGYVQTVYGDFQTVNGMQVPRMSITRFDGGPAPDGPITWDVRVDFQADPTLFKPGRAVVTPSSPSTPDKR